MQPESLSSKQVIVLDSTFVKRYDETKPGESYEPACALLLRMLK